MLTAASVAASPEHVVQSGESLWLLARKYGVTVEALQAANGMVASARIRAGQTLRLPPATKTQPAKAQTAKMTPAPSKKNDKNVGSLPRVAKQPGLEPTRQPEPPPPVKSVSQSSVNARLPPISEQSRLAAERLYSLAAPNVAPNTLVERVPAWVLSQPEAHTQGEKPSAARGGIFPCAAPDPGFAHYAKWIQVAPMAHVLAPPASPQLSSVRADGSFDVVFHFHGREPMRKEWVRAMNDARGDAVLVAVDIGIASEPYRETFRDARTFAQMLLAVEQEMKKRSHNPRAFAQNVTLSSWSAGYGAVAELLTQTTAQSRVGSVVLLDGLHAGFDQTSLDVEKLSPFVRFAKLAAEGKRLMFVSHSSIRTPGYASTTQTARYLAWQVGGQPKEVAAQSADPMGLERYSSFSKGNFHVRGFRGSGASDHCAHLGLMRDVLTVHLQPFWQTQSPRPVAVASLSSN